MRKEQKDRWKRYVESYGEATSKKMHLISCTHVVNRIIDTICDDQDDLQGAYNIAMQEIAKLRKKLGYDAFHATGDGGSK